MAIPIFKVLFTHMIPVICWVWFLIFINVQEAARVNVEYHELQYPHKMSVNFTGDHTDNTTCHLMELCHDSLPVNILKPKWSRFPPGAPPPQWSWSARPELVKKKMCSQTAVMTKCIWPNYSSLMDPNITRWRGSRPVPYVTDIDGLWNQEFAKAELHFNITDWVDPFVANVHNRAVIASVMVSDVSDPMDCMKSYHYKSFCYAGVGINDELAWAELEIVAYKKFGSGLLEPIDLLTDNHEFANYELGKLDDVDSLRVAFTKNLQIVPSYLTIASIESVPGRLHHYKVVLVYPIRSMVERNWRFQVSDTMDRIPHKHIEFAIADVIRVGTDLKNLLKLNMDLPSGDDVSKARFDWKLCVIVMSAVAVAVFIGIVAWVQWKRNKGKPAQYQQLSTSDSLDI